MSDLKMRNYGAHMNDLMHIEKVVSSSPSKPQAQIKQYGKVNSNEITQL